MHLSAILFYFSLVMVHVHATGNAFCKNHPGYNTCLRKSPSVTPFCQSYLQLATSTATTTTTLQAVTTQTITGGSTTVWSPVITTQSQPTGTSTITVSGNGTLASTCSQTTLTPYTTLVTLPPQAGGGTYTYTFTGPNVRMALAAATSAPPAVPACLSGKPSATISSACSCLSLTKPTVTRTKRTTTTDTVSKHFWSADM